MPFEQRKTEPRRSALAWQPYPGGGWSALCSALGSDRARRLPGGQGRAQAQSATPTAEQTDEPRSGLTLPAGIRVARDVAPTSGTPAAGRGASTRSSRRESCRNFNPSAFRMDPQITLSYLEPLVRPDPATMRPTPWLAQRWEWRANGLELVLLLRDDVLWHDGAPLTAADAAFTFEVYRSDTESAVSGLFDARRQSRRSL